MFRLIRISWSLPLIALTAFSSIARADLDARSQALLGIPDAAVFSTSSKERILIKRKQYSLSYNDALRFPNWVSWHLNASDVGTEQRGAFKPDTSLPAGVYQVTPGDYTRSGYDRGHNCPSADRTASRADNDAVFLMSNMTPQAHGMNAGPWEGLESCCRTLAKQGNELYIVCGHGFSSATHGATKSGIALPDFGWKVVVVIPDKPGDDLAHQRSDARHRRPNAQQQHDFEKGLGEVSRNACGNRAGDRP